MSAGGLRLLRAPDRYAIARLEPAARLPEWFASAEGFVTASRSAAELSLLAPEECVPAELEHVERGWAGWFVAGQLDFGMVGVMARLSGALAEAGISLLAISTYDTDWVFVKAESARAAEVAWRARGFEVAAGRTWGETHP